MANLWKQGVQENKDFWKKGSFSDKVGAVAGGVGALSGIVDNSFSLAKGNKTALDSVKNEAMGVNQQMVGSDSLDSIYNTALNYNPMSTNHKWQEFFDEGGYLNYPLYSNPYVYDAGGKILSTGLSNVGSGAMAGMKIGGPWGAAIGGAVGLVGTAIGSLFGHSKAKKMAREANAYAQDANDGMQYKINSAIEDNAHNTLQNYENALPYAYGGYMSNMGAVDYGLARDYLTMKDKQANNKQTPLSYLGNSYIKEKPMTVFDDNNSFANGGGIHIKKSHEGLFTQQAAKQGMSVQEFASHVLANKDKYPASTVRRATFARNASHWNSKGKSSKRYALGGDMQTNGSDFTDGLTEVNAGGTHEENPNGGVPMGMAPDNNPNLVEEGETIYNDYVFSNRIKPDKEALKKFHIYSESNMTYADLSKKLETESKERPNDPISKDGLNAQLSKLAQEQERQKAEEEQKRAEAAFKVLPPEKQQALLQQTAQQQAQQEVQEQQEQQQAEQQEQPNNMQEAQEQQQMSPEEQQAMQQQIADENGNADYGNDNEGYAKGGELHKFAGGGDKNQAFRLGQGMADGIIPGTYSTLGSNFNELQFPSEILKNTPFPMSKYFSSKTPFIPYDRNMTEEDVKKMEDEKHYKQWTDYVLNHWNDPMIVDYLKNMDTATGVHNMYDSKGNEIKGAKDYFKKARTDGKNGWYHMTPVWDENDIIGVSKVGQTAPLIVTQDGNRTTYSTPVPTDDIPDIQPETPEKDKEKGKSKLKMLPTWPRYAGLFGPAIGLGMQAAGIGRNPGESAYNKALAMINSTNVPSPTHIGDYIRYTPYDLWNQYNKNSNARLATNRAIMNNSSSTGAKMYGLIANDNNYYQGNGNLIRQAQEYNNKNMMDVANFNRGTNQFNAQADNQFALAANQNNQWKAQSLMNYAAQKAAQDQQWYSDMYGNVNNLLKGISDYGRENMIINQINNGAINGVYGGGVVGKHSGGASYTAAKGGKINKKKRRGYTF